MKPPLWPGPAGAAEGRARPAAPSRWSKMSWLRWEKVGLVPLRWKGCTTAPGGARGQSFHLSSVGQAKVRVRVTEGDGVRRQGVDLQGCPRLSHASRGLATPARAAGGWRRHLRAGELGPGKGCWWQSPPCPRRAQLCSVAQVQLARTRPGRQGGALSTRYQIKHRRDLHSSGPCMTPGVKKLLQESKGTRSKRQWCPL